MAYPPPPPVNTRADATGLTTNHPADHNAISNALTDILNELGTAPKGSSASVTARLNATWTAFTPQADQGATTNIAKTVTYSKYSRHGQTIHWSCRISFTGSGTAGSNLTLTLPVASVDGGGVTGSAHINDSGSIYVGLLIGLGTTQVFMLPAGGAGYTGWGSSPNLAVGAGDTYHLQVTYEAAP